MSLFYFSKMSLYSIAIFSFISLLLVVFFIVVSKQSSLLLPKIITGVAAILNLIILIGSLFFFLTSSVEVSKEKLIINNFLISEEIEKSNIERIILLPKQNSLKRSFGIDLFGGGIGLYFDENNKYKVATANFGTSILIQTKTGKSYIIGLSNSSNFIKKVNLW